jgi:hypothetical protein
MYSKIVKMVLCLAFVSSEDVLEYYSAIKEKVWGRRLMLCKKNLRYFEKVYLDITKKVNFEPKPCYLIEL